METKNTIKVPDRLPPTEMSIDEYLRFLRRQTEYIVECFRAERPMSRNACIDLATVFQRIDQHLSTSGELPDEWKLK